MRTITDSYITWLPALLQISDAAFPTGSYAHSYGLEEIVRQGAVCDEESLHEFFEERVLPALTHVDLPLAREARFAAISGDRDDLMAVDRLAGALRIPRELREASLQTGRRRLAILIRLRPTPELEALAQIILGDPRAGHHAVVWGVSCARVSRQRGPCGLLLPFRLVPLHSRSEAHSHWSGGNPARADLLSEPRGALRRKRARNSSRRDWLVRSAARYRLDAPRDCR